MITAHFAGTLFTLISVWCLYGLVCLGYGWVWKAWYLPKSTSVSDCIWSFWIGLATLLGLLQIWQLVLPVNGYAFCIFAGAGLLLSLRAIGPAMGAIAVIPFRQRLVAAALVLPMCVWIADRATGPGDFYDSGLYHIPAMEWAGHFGIVPGLANLSLNLGFTSSVTLLAAMMNQGPSAGQAGHYLNGFFLAALAVMVVRGTVAVVASGARGRLDHWVMAFGWMAVTEWGMDPQSSSLSTDVACVVLSLAAAVCFLQIRSAEDPHRRSFLIFCCCALCAVCISAKASAIPFAGPLAVSALLSTRRQPPPNRLFIRLVTPCVFAAVIVGVWIGRQVVLTGYPLFPTPYLATKVDWVVPRETVLQNQQIIRDWARWGSTDVTPGDYSWLRAWYQKRIAPVWYVWKGPVPAGVGVLFLLASLGLRPRWKTLGTEWRAMPWLLLSMAIALTAWWIAAPDPRFCSQLLYLILGCGCALFWTLCLARTSRTWPRLIPVLLSMCLAAGPIISRAMDPSDARDAAWQPPGGAGDLQPTPVASETNWETLTPGSVVLIPKHGDQVWSSPLPNAPFIRPGLTQRNPQRFQDGYRIVPTP